MAQVSKISVALTAEMVALVNQAVESGEYATTSEVVREALREWGRRRTFGNQEASRLRDLWDAGLASGPGRFADMSAIKAEARRRILEERPDRAD
jgi:antitoxin ParD1/3/4